MERRRALLIIVLLAAACRGRIESPSRTTPVVLISIDTLRSDHLPAYGYKGVETPNIDALRADSILYTRAYSHVPLTLPSHATILTGMLPADAGVRDNIGFRLPDSIPTIAQILRSHGYATGAAVSSFILRRETGIGRGFDFFDDAVEPAGGNDTIIGHVQRDGRASLAALEKWIEPNAGRPFFAFLHLYEPHTPYTPPEPYFSRYPNHYDGEIAESDAVVGDFVAFLKQKGVYDKALIILLSDHGEGLSEHGEEEHGIFLYREDLQVPLLVKLPDGRRRGTTVDVAAELADVFPTILDPLAIQVAKDPRRVGRSLLAEVGSPRRIYAESYYPRFHFGWSDLHSLIDGDDHYIRAPGPELYNLRTDPAEKRNTLERNRRAYARLRDAIAPYVHEPAAPSGIDREDAAKLAALGYIGSTAATPTGGQLPDPKMMMGTFHDIRLALTLYRSDKPDEALRLTNQLLAANAQITDLWDLKCKILNKLGKTREAVEAAKEGLRHVPMTVQLLYDVANGALALGDLDTAQQHAEIAGRIEPGESHEILARIWLRRQDTQRAEAEAKLALETSHDPTTSLMLLAGVEKQRNNFPAALAYLERAKSSHAGLHLERGDVLARLGRNADAENEFRAEIAQFPSIPTAYSSLIMLLATEHRFDEATKVVFDCIKAAPAPHSYAVIAETLKAIGDDKGAHFWAYQGLQRYPDDPELRALPGKLERATGILRKHMADR
ncbi:MAG TPA: sulfatase-like hydrolase/transferase [Thermoanaerobaculia bacterium]|nr:sulfatase-like hydrolase/transferase [Thermoanaerobaculia bacterium]